MTNTVLALSLVVIVAVSVVSILASVPGPLVFVVAVTLAFALIRWNSYSQAQ